MASVLSGRLEAFITRYPNLRAAGRVGIAVSGGADSTCLARLSAELGLPIVLLHMNYGLRGDESAEDERFVLSLAREMGAPAIVERVDAPSKAEDALRKLRYEWFQRSGVDAVLTGHTKEDQAETVLFRLLRGSGPLGLAGIRPLLDRFVYRPLLDSGREEVRDWLRERNFPWREDSSNLDLAYRRNWIRRELIPLIEREVNPHVSEGLASLAAIANDEEEWLAGLVDEVLDDIVEPEGKALIVDCRHLRQTPMALRRRLVRRSIERVKGDLFEIDFAHIAAALELMDRPEGAGRLQVPGVDLLRSFDWVRVMRLEDVPNLDTRNFRFPLPETGDICLPENAGTLRVTRSSRSTYNKNGEGLDWDRLRLALWAGESLELRNWRPGDCLQRGISEKAVKIKELFQIHRVPLWRRRSWPIAVLGDVPVWAAMFGPAAEFGATDTTVNELRIEWTATWPT